MTTKTVPFLVWPWPVSDANMALMRAAKTSLPLDYLIQPVGAFPGCGGRVLAFGERPPFACESALVVTATVEAVRAAMQVCLSDEPDSRLFTYEDYLSAVMGVPVYYSHTEEIETGKVVFHER